MKINGITRSRMKNELKKLQEEREKSVLFDQCVLLPLTISESNMAVEPEKEERDDFEKSFKEIPGYKDEILYPLITISSSAAMTILSSITVNPFVMVSKEFEDKVLDFGYHAAEHYIDKMHLFTQSDLDENPYIKKIKVNASVGKTHIETKKYDKLHICLGSDFKEDGYSYCHDIDIATEDITVPVIRVGNKIVERVSMTEINLTKEAIKRAHGNVLALDTSAMQYFAYMTHLKEEVESVTILINECDKAELFRKYILPEFDYPDKVRVIYESEQAFNDMVAEKKYHFCFCRLWDEFNTNLDLYMNYTPLPVLKTHIEFFTYMEGALLEHIKNIIISDILMQAGMEINFGVQASNEDITAVMDRFKNINIMTPDNLTTMLRAGKIKEHIIKNEKRLK